MAIFLKILFGLSLILSGQDSDPDPLYSYLGKNISDYTKFEYEIVNLPGGLEIYSPDKLNFDFYRSFRIQNGYGYIPVLYSAAGKKPTRAIVTVRLRIYGNVFVAKRDLRRHTVVKKGDFGLEERIVSGLRFSPCREDVLDLEKYRLKSNLKADEILLSSNIEKDPVIKIGSSVEAMLIKENLSISFMAKSRGEGSIGDEIRVIREDKRIFNAEIISQSQVKIIE